MNPAVAVWSTVFLGVLALPIGIALLPVSVPLVIAIKVKDSLV